MDSRPRRTSPTEVRANDSARCILDLQLRLARCDSLPALLSVLADELPSLLPARERVSLALLEAGGEWMRVYRLLPPVEPTPLDLPRVCTDGTVVGRVARDGVGQVVADVRTDPNITFGHASHDGIRSTESVPVLVAGHVVGVMNAGSRTIGACRGDLLEHLADVAAVVGPAILAAERLPALSKAVSDGPESGLVGRSPAFRALLGQARRAAQSDATVLLTGETGVGKTALARAIHGWSDRRERPFVPVHLADLPATLVESELFGHERGAFTGASQRRLGRFEMADRGTLFLDEIGEAPLSVQSKLLRVLQDGRFERVGGGATLETQVRVIAATNRDLHEAVARGEFRRDLLYRLEIVPLHVPSLRDRAEDLDPLIEAILARLRTEQRRPLRLSPEAWQRARAHAWPGNVRELESVLLRASVLEEGEELRLTDFESVAGGDRTAPAADPADWPTRDEQERRYLRRVLEHTGGLIEGRRGAARLLGMQPSTLRSRMKRLGVSVGAVRREGDR